MKKTLLFSVCAALTASLVSCGGPGGKAKTAETADAKTAKKAVPEYTVVDNAQVDLASFPQDKDGYYVIFDGKTLNGWRGYGKDKAPSRWTVEDGAIKFNGSGGGEAQTGEGGDLIFAKKFKNFELEMEWKVSKGGNSGIFYLAQEVTTQKDGKTKYEPIYISCPESPPSPPFRRTRIPSASGTRPRSWFTKARSYTARTTRTSWSTTCGLPSGPRCWRTASSAPRSGPWRLSC